jgi:Ca-activated chloride channel homolog
MNFLAPGAFFLGLLLPVIIALYLLKLRRVELTVPSNYLWRRMVRDVEANAPWQKLRANLLMILQLLVLIALIFALARPFNWTEGAGGQAAIIILDTSASMAAQDVSPNRLESAKQRANQLVDDLPDSARTTIIEAGQEARVLLSSSLDRRQAHLVIDKTAVATGTSDMSVALELASAIAARQPGTEIIVLSDGKAELPKRLVVKGSLRYIPFGLSGENRAISLLNLEGNPGSGSLTAFVQVTNYGDVAASSRLSIFADGLLVNAIDLADIPPGGQKSAISEGIPAGTHVVSAQITDPKDALSLDNKADAVRPDIQPAQVTLVTQGNRFIKTALSLLPGVELREQLEEPQTTQTTSTTQPTPSVEPTQRASASQASGQPALTIYDNFIPTSIAPTGSLLFIAPPASTDYFSTTGMVKNPQLRPVDIADPLLNNLSLTEVNILDAVQIPLPVWATPVVAGDLENGNIPLIFRGSVDGRRIAVIAFDVRHSDLPLQVAFPLLWANLVNWLVPGSGSTVPAQVAPGEAILFNAPENNQMVMLTRPDGSTIQIAAENNRFHINDTSQLGVYELQFKNSAGSGQTQSKTAAFAVNLFSSVESAIKPADRLPGVEAENTSTGAASRLAQREWWRSFALLALGLLVGEWLVYQRAALARLRDLVRGVRIKSARARS